MCVVSVFKIVYVVHILMPSQRMNVCIVRVYECVYCAYMDAEFKVREWTDFR